MIKIKVASIITLIIYFFTCTGLLYKIYDNRLIARSLPTLALVDISTDEISKTNRTKIGTLLRNKFEYENRFRIIPKTAVNNYINNELERRENLGGITENLREAETLYEQGRALYDNAQFEESIIKIKDAIKKYEDNFRYLKNNVTFVNCYLYLALCYLARNKKADARLAFESILKYKSNFKLTTKMVSPNVIKLFKKVKKEMKIYDKSNLILDINESGAEVFLNGNKIRKSKKGKPMAIKGLLPGKHTLMVERKGFIKVFKTFIAKKGTVKISVILEEKRFLKLISDDSTRSKNEFIDVIISFGNNSEVNANIVILYSISTSSGIYKLKAQAFDTSTRQHTKSFSAVIGETIKFPGGAVDKIESTIIAHIDASGHVVPELLQAEAGQRAPQTGYQQPTGKGPYETQPVPPPYYPPHSKKSKKKRGDAASLETKKAIAWTIIGLLILGGGATGLALWLTTKDKGKITIHGP